MKKIAVVSLVVALISTAAKAQFEQGTKFIGASLTGLDLSYGVNEKVRLGLEASGGYFIADNVLVKAHIGYQHNNHTDDLRLGLTGRYYFIENGIFIGAGTEFSHLSPKNNDLMLPLEAGYAFYLNHYLTIEPAIYYKMSLMDFGKNNTIGLRLGFGFYF